MTLSQEPEVPGLGTPDDGLPREQQRPSQYPVEGMPVRRRTLPPPEWSAPRSVSGIALEWLARHSPVARRRGSRAEVASLRAKLEAASSGESEGERAAASALARALAARGAELDTATKLARRSLMLGEDPSLREELSSWFAALGEPGLAAATLKSLVEVESGERLGRLLIRIAVFLGRHGEGRAAAEALANAARECPNDPVPDELRGAIAAWAPDAVSAEDASAAYLEAARRREAQGDKAAAFEDLLRAFEIAPEHGPAAQRLAGDLAQRGRPGAADEVLREHARASGAKGIATHRARLRDAIVDGDSARALGAAFDAGLDRGFDPRSIARTAEPEDSGADLVTFDRLLADLGLNEILAARLELSAEALTGAERARARVAHGRVCAGAIGSTERAVESWIDALVAQPSNEDAKSLLREYAASTGDHMPLVEALVRAGTKGAEAAREDRVACLRELVVLADQRLSDPSLALWAVRLLLSDDHPDEELRAIGSRLSQRARLQDESLTSIRVQLGSAKGPGRIDLLRVAAVALRGRPDEADEYTTVLEELVREVPEERTFRLALERVLARRGRAESLQRMWRDDLEHQVGKAQQERARLGLSALARARGDVTAALEALAPLGEDPSVNRAGWGMLFALATNAGRGVLRASALRRIAQIFDTPLCALLSSIAADLFLVAGDEVNARRAAEQACHADGASPRSIAALARATIGQRDRVAGAALERAVGVVLPRAFWCRALAETFDALGEPMNALAWTQRGLALRPGDRAAGAALLERVTAAGDPARIGDSLSWLLAQPQPLTDLVPLVSRAVCRLSEIDPPRGAALARRALDVFGPRVREIRDAVLAAADSVGERGLSIAVLERQLASGAPGSDRAEMLLDLARRRRHAGDADGAARSLVRALAEGADPGAVLHEIDVALPPRSSDGEISLLEGRAEALSALSTADLEGTARAWRDLGAARWDLADDREGAIAAWERAAALDGENGVEKFARDLVAFGGHEEAVKRLDVIATRRRNRADVARALAAAACVALDGGLEGIALGIAIRALEADSSRADVLGIAERAAKEKDIELLERAYDIIANGALGMYGERAAHYRAARQLERRGFRERGLRHAILAFEAVPAEGVTFVLMMRLAERAGDSTEAVQAIERVASHAKSPEERAAWLRRAALVAGSGDEGKRQRVDVLLRALDANPHSETLRSLGTALVELVRALPDDRDVAELRFTRAVRSMLPRLEGPDGARVAVEAAGTALGTFGVRDVAFAALIRATESDASIDEYQALLPLVATLGADKSESRRFVEHTEALVRSPHANTAAPLVELAEAIGLAAGDSSGVARLLVAAAEREPEDTDLLERAEQAARASGDTALLGVVLAAVPLERRIAALLERAEGAAAKARPAEAIAALEEAWNLDRLPDGVRTDIASSLRKLYRDARRWDELESLLREVAPDATVEARVAQGRELAGLLAELDRADEAFEVFDALLSLAPNDKQLLADFFTQAVAADAPRRQIEALTRLTELETETPKRLALLRKLAVLLGAEGDEVGAVARFRQILAIDPRDTSALGALERDAEHRGDWEAFADLLLRRTSLSQSADESRQVRLHRAQILESRLGRSQDARLELEALLAETGDHLHVLTRLADLNERLGAKLRAAPLWLRASAIPKERAEAGELSRRACQSYLDGGDVESARRIFGEMGEYPRTPKLVALRVDIERRSENPLALSEALEEMALSSMDPPKSRAGLLVEAARAALVGGQLPLALGQAQRAARIARDLADPQLFARLLEYRKRGAGTRDESAATILELRAIRDALDPSQRELQAFLIAEALDVSAGEGEGMRELSRVHAELGSLPLISLGMGERLARGPEPERALPSFDAALEGDLRELRRRGEVALAAGVAAERAKLPDRALEYLEIAAAMPDTRARALAAQTELRTALGRLSDAPPVGEKARSRPVSDPPEPEMPAFEATMKAAAAKERSEEAAVIELRPKRTEETPVEPILELRRPSDPPIELKVRRDADSVRPELPRPTFSEPSAPIREPGALRASAPPKPLAPRRTSTVPAMPAPPSAGSPTGPVAPAQQPQPQVQVRELPNVPFAVTLPVTPAVSPASLPVAPLVTESVGPSTIDGAPPSPPRSQTLPRTQTFRGTSPNEETLLSALARGSIDAGRELIAQLENRSDRTHDLVSVCRRVAYLLPGDRAILERLYDSTLADRDIVYARAVEHVLRAFDPKAAPLEPPPLSDQIEQPDRVHAVLFRDATSPATEALGLVWSGAQHMFRRDPSSYGVTGLERVAPSSPSPLARQFGAACRLLGMMRTPLFQRKSGETITINVALLTPPALLLTGEVKSESPALGYHLGAMLAATMPEHVLLYGAPEAQVENVLKALLAAFGPPRSGGAGFASIATLAEMLWESMPARSQRRLRELCDDPSRIDYALARGAARQAVRRAGLFVSGDLTVAVREACADLGISTWGLDAPGGLAALCSSSPAVADLVKLATSQEYANARWHQMRGGGRAP